MTRLGIVGDVHARWSPARLAALDQQGYDGLLFTGDLGDPLHRGVRRTASAIARLHTPAVVIPGNHDGPSPLGVLREALGLGHTPAATRRILARTQDLQAWLGRVPLAGYSVHRFGDVSVVAGRPWSMGGMSFATALQARHGVGGAEASGRRIAHLLRQAPGAHVVLLAHNGPAGLGAAADAPWAVHGRGDLGDDDLAAARDRADDRLCAIVAGHVHHGEGRRWHVQRAGVHHVNAARPRTPGWHVVLDIDAEVRVHARQLALPQPLR